MGIALIVSVIGDISNLSKNLDAAGGDVKGFGGISLATATKVSVVAGAAVTAGAAIYGMAKAADADRTEAAKLSAAIAAVGAETATTTAQVDAAIAAGQEKAFTDSETREAMASLVTATKDVGQATDLLTDAQNIARFAGVDLATAADAVAKAQAGQDGALRKLVPGLAKGAKATDTIAAASKAAAGQADIFANSAEGMEAKAGDAFGELTETIGEVFLPILDEVIPAVIPIIKAFGELIKMILPILIPLVKTLAQAIGILAKALAGALKFIKDVLTWVKKLLKPLDDMLHKLEDINPFSGMSFPSFGAASASATGLGVNALAGSGGGGGGVTINIYGDPAVIEAKVIRALRGYQMRNGVGSILTPGRI